MSRKEILNKLNIFKAGNEKQYGMISLGLFGSVARNTSDETSDVDVVVKLKKQDLFNIIGIKQDLEEILNTSVDVISYREKMNDFLKSRIDKEAVYV
jgi:predicted nucleotidyltransferase